MQELNYKWLHSQGLTESDGLNGERNTKPKHAEGSYRRFLSRRGTFNTITFSSVDSIPPILLETNAPLNPTTKPVSFLFLFLLLLVADFQ
jgi:hypothetical protein